MSYCLEKRELQESIRNVAQIQEVEIKIVFYSTHDIKIYKNKKNYIK